jgi:hypothetical protein
MENIADAWIRAIKLGKEEPVEKELRYNKSMKRNIEVIRKCKAEVWSGMTQLGEEEYSIGDLIPTFSSDVDGNDVVVVTDDGPTLIFPIDCVSVG